MIIAKTLIVTNEEEKCIRSTYERNEFEINKDIADIKEWLKKQPHLPQDEDDIRIKKTLLLNKCSMEKTKKKLDSYNSLKHIVPEIYENREPLHPSIISLMDNLLFLPLPRLTPACHRVYISRYLNNDASKFDLTIYYKMVFGVFDLQLMYDLSLGEHLIIDFEHSTYGHLVQCTPANIKKAYALFARAYSDRLKGLHLLNLPSSANSIVTLFTSILSQKIANRVFVHKNLESLHKSIPKEILPFEYGGKYGVLNDLYGEWRNYLCSKNDWIKTIGDKKSDESKRVGDRLDTDLFGMCGSFRKLDLD